MAVRRTLLVPVWNKETDWCEQYEEFMRAYGNWGHTDWCGKAVTGKDEWANMKVALGNSVMTGPVYLKGAEMWVGEEIDPELVGVKKIHLLAFQRLKKAVEMKNKNFIPTWAPEGDKYAHKAMVTLNLPTTANMAEAYKCATEWINSTEWIERAEYSIEYHTSGINHAHAHILIHTNNGRYNSCGNIRNALFDKKTNKIRNKILKKYLEAGNFIDVKIFHGNSSNYIQGNKTDEKEEKCVLDKIMRKEEGLEDFYIIQK